MKPKTTRRRPMTLSAQHRRELICRLLLVGSTAEAIAKRLHVSSRTIRDVVASATFQRRFAELQREYLTVVDRRIARLLHRALKALVRLLKRPDWRAVDAAIDKVLRLHAKYVERIDITGSACTLTHPGHPLQQPLDDMSPEQRLLAREFLKSFRTATRPRVLDVSSGVRDDAPPGQS